MKMLMTEMIAVLLHWQSVVENTYVSWIIILHTENITCESKEHRDHKKLKQAFIVDSETV